MNWKEKIAFALGLFLVMLSYPAVRLIDRYIDLGKGEKEMSLLILSDVLIKL